MVKRREFLPLATAAGLVPVRLFGAKPGAGDRPLVRFGVFADLHFANRNPPDYGPRYEYCKLFYREGLEKVRIAVGLFNARGLDFAIELGDFKDQSPTVAETLSCLEAAERAFSEFRGPRYHVLGNHDTDVLTKEEFLARVANAGQERALPHYSFAVNGVTFVALDACYERKDRPYSRCNPWTDANVPPVELAWLRGELARAPGPVVAFCHQCLCNAAGDAQCVVRNADEVRAVLEASGKVKAVITGHDHDGGAKMVNGILHYTVAAIGMRLPHESCCCAEVAVHPSGAVTVTGFRKAKNWPAA